MDRVINDKDKRAIWRTFLEIVVPQKATSRNTSINSSRLPKGISYLIANKALDKHCVFDLGCGKFDNSKEAIESKGARYIGFDPFNRDTQHNVKAVTLSTLYPPHYIVCSNVLNVIDSDDALLLAIKRIATLIHATRDAEAVITIYEGKKNGEGRYTKADQYQRNQPLKYYAPLFEAENLTVKTHKGCLIVSTPFVSQTATKVA